MEKNKEFELVVAPGNRHFFELLLAAVFYAAFLFLVGMTIYSAILSPDLGLFIGNMNLTLSSGGFLLAMGLRFSMVKEVLIDLDADKLVSRYCVGPFVYSRKTEVPDLDYIAVFWNLKEEFEVNLWYAKNKHYKMYLFDEKEDAFQFAERVAERLNLELLDATERGNSKWIEKM